MNDEEKLFDVPGSFVINFSVNVTAKDREDAFAKIKNLPAENVIRNAYLVKADCRIDKKNIYEM